MSRFILNKNENKKCNSEGKIKELGYFGQVVTLQQIRKRLYFNFFFFQPYNFFQPNTLLSNPTQPQF